MRIVITGIEICGLIHDLAVGLKKRGHDVITVADSNWYFSYTYDYPQAGIFGAYFSSNRLLRRLANKVLGAIRKISRATADSIDTAIRKRIFRGTDLYIQVWGEEFPQQQEILKFVKQEGAKIATLFMGSDVRCYRLFAEQYEIFGLKLPKSHLEIPRSTKLKRVRLHERYADAIFSVPDQMGLALRSYHHSQIPMHVNEYVYNLSSRDEPLVIHAPSNRGLKGSILVEECVDRLRMEGVRFEFRSVRDMPNTEIRKLLTEADVLIDEVGLHGPGFLSVEAMLSGCAVATRYLQESPASFRPPVVPVDPANLYEPVKRLLTDKAWRVEVAKKGRAYALENNNADKVIDNLLERTNRGADGEHDYHPTYLRDEWQPSSDEEAEEINRFNETVRNEAWYRENLAGRQRGSLRF